ncbi:MAG: thiol oxidoreductase, partial [Candidatus Rokuibacteriota bacterium]
DGRTTDLIEAIEAHASTGDHHVPPSEANAVIARFRALGQGKKQDLLNFLRSL